MENFIRPLSCQQRYLDLQALEPKLRQKSEDSLYGSMRDYFVTASDTSNAVEVAEILAGDLYWLQRDRDWIEERKRLMSI